MEVKIGPGGRIALPAAFRDAMETGEGDTLVAMIDGDGVVQLTSASAALRMAQRIVSETIPGDVSLSDSLIEDRRRETGR
ncbi:MAG: AbrB/MazE/SpoVT family DNA-binding domain-containing protein [Defluviicoccus sp.]|nr:AbrB/MazE/SpoVT family DNA-binding domain-containing protein [Defluviicoccus sp.]